MAPLLEMKKIYKSFLGVNALIGVDFTLERGQVHALMGENGAGKSTLIKVLTGVYSLDDTTEHSIYNKKNSDSKKSLARNGGQIILDEKSIRPGSPFEAQKFGISSVYQEVNLCPNLSVAENIMIGREPMGTFGIKRKLLIKKARETLSRLSLDIDVERPLSAYSVGIQQMIAITRALDLRAKILILDEPTSSLDEKEVKELFKAIRKIKEDGLGVIFVTHFLDQTYEISDAITVLRNGERIGTYQTKDLQKLELIKKMIGKEYEEIEGISSKKEQTDRHKESFISIDKISKKGFMRPVSFDIERGSIVGFAGLLGSGRSETASLIFGITKPDEGKITVKGKEVNFSNPSDAALSKFGFCPEDRKMEGIISDLSVRENIILALQSRMGIFKSIPRKKQNEIAAHYIKALSIATSDAEKPIKDLSGGNQQKALLARWLATDPELLILDEPTRGIDIGAKSEIQKLMLKLRSEGVSFIFISSEIEEIVRCSDKAIVFKDKTQIATIGKNEISEKNILNIIAYGGK